MQSRTLLTVQFRTLCYRCSPVHCATGVVPYSVLSVQFRALLSVFRALCYRCSPVHCQQHTIVLCAVSHFSISSVKKPFLALTSNYSQLIKRTLAHALMHQLASHCACRRPNNTALSRPLLYIIGVINLGLTATREMHRQCIVTTGQLLAPTKYSVYFSAVTFQQLHTFYTCQTLGWLFPPQPIVSSWWSKFFASGRNRTGTVQPSASHFKDAHFMSLSDTCIHTSYSVPLPLFQHFVSPPFLLFPPSLLLLFVLYTCFCLTLPPRNSPINNRYLH